MGLQRQNGTEVTAQYTGLADKTVAIVVYTDQANTFEYPQTRKEISNFVASAMRQSMPKIKLVDPDDVIKWQNETLNWASVSEKEIGKHFGVDRVLYIEVLDYGTREPNSTDLLRGRIRSNCKVFETDTAAAAPAWKQDLNVYWPENGPMDATHGSDTTARQRVLETFAGRLSAAFVDHREADPDMRSKMQETQ